MCRFTIFIALVVFIFVASLGYAEETQSPKEEPQSLPKVQLTYGPGGPERKAHAIAGEQLYIRLELPKSLSFNGKTDLWGELSLVSQVDQTKFFRSPVNPLQGFSTKNASSVFLGFLTVPPDFEEGKYDLILSLLNPDRSVLCEGKETIDLCPTSSFGIRNFTFIHGFISSTTGVPGPNVFVVGAYAKFAYAVSGLSLNPNEEFDAVVKSTLVDSEGVSIDIMEPTFLLSRSEVFRFADLGLPWVTLSLPLVQPGNFVLKIEVEDLNAQKKESLELPLYVVDPNSYQ